MDRGTDYDGKDIAEVERRAVVENGVYQTTVKESYNWGETAVKGVV